MREFIVNYYCLRNSRNSAENAGVVWLKNVCEKAFSLMYFNTSKHRFQLTDSYFKSTLTIATIELTSNLDILERNKA